MIDLETYSTPRRLEKFSKTQLIKQSKLQMAHFWSSLESSEQEMGKIKLI